MSQLTGNNPKLSSLVATGIGTGNFGGTYSIMYNNVRKSIM